MKRSFNILLLILSLTTICVKSHAQKKAIDATSYKTWEKLDDRYEISNNGKYVWYCYGSMVKRFLVLSTSDGKYQTTFNWTGEPPFFTQDSKKLVFRKAADSLAVLELGTREFKFINGVSEFRCFDYADASWLICSKRNQFLLQDLNRNKQFLYPPVKSFWLSPGKNKVIVQTLNNRTLSIDILTQKSTEVSRLADISSLTIDNSGNHMAFISRNYKGDQCIYEYHTGLDSAILLVDKSNLEKEKFLEFNEPLTFSPDGRHLYFGFKKIADSTQKDQELISEKVVVWSYKDRVLKHQTHVLENGKESYNGVISVEGGQPIVLDTDSTSAVQMNNFGNEYFLTYSHVDIEQAYWSATEWPCIYLTNISSGGKKKIITPDMTVHYQSVGFTPDGKFVKWTNKKTGDLYTYEIKTAAVRNVTEKIQLPYDILQQRSENPVLKISSDGILGWTSGYKAFVLTDKYDLWLIDPLNKEKPVNLTLGYGRKHNVTFQLEHNYSDLIKPDFDNRVTLLTQNNRTKSYGYATLVVGEKPDLKILVENDCLFSYNDGNHIAIKKAKNASVFLALKETATDASNIFISKDLKTFRRLSNVKPQSAYNWMSTKLINWKMYNGEPGEGILYLPENFDSSKKYPVLFYYYQDLDNKQLHHFLNLSDFPPSRSNLISIPEYVSAGYVVFWPQILNTKPGHIAEATINSVESAAKYLVNTYPWVDAKRLGIQGHSMGGYETNILVANSNLFAAACTSAGAADMISKFGARIPNWGSDAGMTEVGQYNLGSTPWDSVQVYIRNSPLFNAAKVTTPLLINHGNSDGKVPFNQAIEWYTALRRLGKKVWMLEYEFSGHLFVDDDAKDLAIRQRQFFDHYLMGKPAPIWMTEGVPTKYQGIKSGLQLDLSGKQP